MLVKVLTVLAALAVLAVGALIFLGDDWKLFAMSGEPSKAEQTQDAGITVLTRKPYEPRVTASVAAEPELAYALELGAAKSFNELSARFATIANQNAESGMDRLEPHATLVETANGLEARLLVGPVATSVEAQATCASLALPQGVTCRVVPFSGERIARQ